MKIYSSNFNNGERIPDCYTCQGDDYNPPLFIEDLPDNTKTIALVVDDPDSAGKPWIHWLIWNIPASNPIINEASVPAEAVQGVNDFGKIGYGGPCPSQGLHHYRFTAYALDVELSLTTGAMLKELEEAMFNHIIDKATYTGNYSLTNQ